MTLAPAVSCIVIFLNEERFLAEAIDSVLAQDHRIVGVAPRRRWFDGRQRRDRTCVCRAAPRPRPVSAARRRCESRHERGAEPRPRPCSRPLRGVPRRRRRLAARETDRTGRDPGRSTGRRHGLRSNTALAQLAVGRCAPIARSLLRPRRDAGNGPRATPVARAADREPLPDPDDLQCVDPPVGHRRRGRLRAGVPRDVRGPGVLHEGLPRPSRVRRLVLLGQVPPAGRQSFVRMRMRRGRSSRPGLDCWRGSRLFSSDDASCAAPVWQALRREQFALRSPRVHRQLERLRRVRHSVVRRWRG